MFYNFSDYDNELMNAQVNLLQSKSSAMRKAKDILQQKGAQFNNIKFDKTVLEAIGLMKTENVSYLIVIDKNDKYMGVFSERDYTHKVILEGKQSSNTKVSDIMATNLANASPDDSTSKLMLLINNSKARYLPVFDGVDFKGIITIHDLMREAMADYEQGRQSLDNHELEFLKTHVTK